jgi:hypothetical protein
MINVKASGLKCKASGKTELQYWQSLSGLTKGSMSDHMNKYLGSLGHTGTLKDRIIKWAGGLGSGYWKDNLRAFFK